MTSVIPVRRSADEHTAPEPRLVRGRGAEEFEAGVRRDAIGAGAVREQVGGAPTINQIVFRVIPDDSARFLALKAGDIQGLEQAVVEDLAAAEADPNLTIITRPALNTSYLAFNFKIVEFQDIKVREAFAHAIDKEGLITNFFGKYGEVAKNMLPPLVWGHNDAVVDWTYDPALSKQLLSDAGFPDGSERSHHC